VLPTNTLNHKDQVSVEFSAGANFWGEARVGLIVAAFSCNSSGVTILGADFNPGWSGAVQCDATRSVCTVVASLNNRTASFAGGLPFSLTLVVNTDDSATNGGDGDIGQYFIEGNVKTAYGVGGAPIPLLSSAILFVDRTAVVSSRGMLFAIAGNAVAGLILRAEQTTFFNMASLGSSANISSALAVHEILAQGGSRVAGDSVSCSSSDTDVLQVDPTCQTAFLTGAETGGGLVTITARLDGRQSIATSLTFRVFYPVFSSVRITTSLFAADDTAAELKTVAGWYTNRATAGQSERCVLKRQWFTPMIEADFVSGQGSATFSAVSVTEHVLSALAVSDAAVAVIQQGAADADVTVQGVGTGDATLYLDTKHHGKIGGLDVRVTDAVVNVHRIESHALSSVGLAPTHVELGLGERYSPSLIYDDQLRYHDVSADVVALAFFSDGSSGRLTDFDLAGLGSGVEVNNMASKSVRATAGTYGRGPLATIAIRSSCGSSVASGVVSGNASTAAVVALVPGSLEVTIAHADSVAVAPVNLSLSPIRLTYDDGRASADVASVSSLIKYDDEAEDPHDIFRVVRGADGVPYVVATSLHSHGQAHLVVTSPAAASAVPPIRIKVRVLNAISVSVRAVPYPAYPGSDSVAVSALRRIGNQNSGLFQEAQLVAELKLSNGEIQLIAADTALQFVPIPAGILNIGAEGKVSVVDDLSSGQVSIHANYKGLQTTESAVIAVSQAVLKVESIVDLHYDYVGLPIGSQVPPTFGVVLSNGLELAAAALVLPSGEPARGLARFGAGANTPEGGSLQINPTTGVMTLLGNLNAFVKVLAGPPVPRGSGKKLTATGPGVTVMQVFPNLEPAVGDVDLGFGGGDVALPDSAVGSTFEVPVRLNVGASELGAFQLRIKVEGLVGTVKYVGYTAGAEFALEGPAAGNHFRHLDVVTDGSSNTVDVAGFEWGPRTAAAGGSPVGSDDGDSDSTPSPPPPRELIRLRFQGVAAGTYSFSGTVAMVSNADGTPIGSSGGTSIVAGQVAGNIVGDRRRRLASQVPDVLATRAASATAIAATAGQPRSARDLADCTEGSPCATCGAAGAPPIGDANGDCVADIRDVAFLFKTVLTDSDPVTGRATVADIDGNGRLDMWDPFYLLQFLLGRWAVAEQLTVEVASERSACLLTIQTVVWVFDGEAGQQRRATGADVQVFFDLESAGNAALTDQLAASTLAPGSVAFAQNKSRGYYGAVWKAEANNGQFMIRADSAIKTAALGVSVIVATNSFQGQPSARRTAPLLTGSPVLPYSYGYALAYELPLGRSVLASIRQSAGYNPRRLVAHPITTSECLGGATAFPSTSTATTATATVTTTTTATQTSTTRTSTTSQTSATSTRTSITTAQPLATVPSTTTSTRGGVGAAGTKKDDDGSGSTTPIVVGVFAALFLLVAVAYFVKRDDTESKESDADAYAAAALALSKPGGVRGGAEWSPPSPSPGKAAESAAPVAGEFGDEGDGPPLTAQLAARQTKGKTKKAAAAEADDDGANFGGGYLSVENTAGDNSDDDSADDSANDSENSAESSAAEAEGTQKKAPRKAAPAPVQARKASFRQSDLFEQRRKVASERRKSATMMLDIAALAGLAEPGSHYHPGAPSSPTSRTSASSLDLDANTIIRRTPAGSVSKPAGTLGRSSSTDFMSTRAPNSSSTDVFSMISETAFGTGPVKRPRAAGGGGLSQDEVVFMERPDNDDAAPAEPIECTYMGNCKCADCTSDLHF
jgi:hypothetical protein